MWKLLRVSLILVCTYEIRQHAWTTIVKILCQLEITRWFSNHKSCLLPRSHTFTIIVILVQLPWYYMKECGNSGYISKLNQKFNDPKMIFDPTSVEVMCDSTQRPFLSKPHENMSRYVDTVTPVFFFKNLNQRSLTPWWPLTPSLLRSHVWLLPKDQLTGWTKTGRKRKRKRIQ